MFLNQKPERVILNRELKVFSHYSTIDGKRIDSRHYSVTCFLNDEKDYLQVDFAEIKDVNDMLEFFGIIKVFYINSENQSKEVNFKKSVKNYGMRKSPNIRIDLKNILLNLFHIDGNMFIIKFGYKFNKHFINSEHLIVLPSINERKEWIPNAIQMNNMETEHTTTIVLKNLYSNDFELTEDSLMEEIRVQASFKLFIESPWEEKPNSYDLINIFRSQLMIEDLKQNEDYKKYQLNNQIIQNYKAASLELKDKMVEHLLKHMCLKKAIRYLENAHFILIVKKMPFDLEDIEGIRLTEMESSDIYTRQMKISIDYVVNNEIIIFHFNVNIKDCLYNVQFIPNRSLICMAYETLTKCDRLNVNTYLVSFDSPFSKYNTDRDSEIIRGQFQYKNRNIAKNIEQKTAIRRIMERSAFPSPYLLHGPPGSGKTTTIIEAIVQLVTLKPYTRILMVASSNIACNDISDRLMKHVSCNKILRIYSSKYERQQNAENIIRPKCRSVEICGDCLSRYCEDLQKNRDHPCYEEFYSARVVIVTLAGSVSLIKAEIRSDHFDYIFIDDATSIPEALILIPIVGLGTSDSTKKLKITADIILCGDPIQLEPTVTHPFNLKLGMDCSMMERMLKKVNKYRCDNYAETQRNHHVTQLFNCFRSHRAIVRFAYVHFYGSQLKSSFKNPEDNFASEWKHLKNRDFPIMFMDSKYSDDCELFGKVLLKKAEMNVINYYVNSLLVEGIDGNKVLPEDIGIISMDLAQPNTIIDQLKLCYPNVEIGTVESFQGREKKVIFLSTIRTDTKSLGCKRTDKRLIVALTRAKFLLVVVGNADKLQNCDMWSKFIMYCINNNAYVEAPLEKPIEDDDNDNVSNDDEEDNEDSNNYDGF